jgi:hypothetical protein
MSHITSSASFDSEQASVSVLVPEYIRESAENFTAILEEYYKYLNERTNVFKGITTVINSIPDQHDLTRVDTEYLAALRKELGPYIPQSPILDDRDLFEKIVKYFYNTRGSVESVGTFFKIFYGVDGEIDETPDTAAIILESTRITSASPDHYRSVSDGSIRGTRDLNSRRTWRPYEYAIKTELQLSEWELPYRALIHPVGFRFYAIVLFAVLSKNSWATQSPYAFNYISSNITDWFVQGVEGQHSPQSQPGWTAAYIRSKLIDLLASFGFDEMTQSDVESIFVFLYSLGASDSQYERNKVTNLALVGPYNDQSTLGSIGFTTIADYEAESSAESIWWSWDHSVEQIPYSIELLSSHTRTFSNVGVTLAGFGTASYMVPIVPGVGTDTYSDGSSQILENRSSPDEWILG